MIDSDRYATDSMAAIKVKVLNADFEETVQLRPDEPLSVAFQAVQEKHCAFKVTSFCLCDSELQGEEIAKDCATLGCIFIEAETSADLQLSKIIANMQTLKPKFEPMDRHSFLKMVFERGFLEGGDILWRRMVGDADRLEDPETWSKLVTPMLEVVHRTALVHSTVDPVGSPLMKLTMGDFVSATGPEVWHHDRHRQPVQCQNKDGEIIQGWTTTRGTRGGLMLRSRQPLLLASAMQLIANFHAENEQEIAEEEERKLDAECPVLPEREKKRRPADRVPRIAGRRQPTKARLTVGPGKVRVWGLKRDLTRGDRQGHRSRIADREIARLQHPSSPELLIPRAAFQRLVRQTLQEVVQDKQQWEKYHHGSVNRLNGLAWMDDDSFTFTRSALETLQIAAEGFLVELMEDGAAVATHCRRRTLMLKDVTFLRYIKKDPSLQPKLQC